MRLTSSRAYTRPPPVPKMPSGLVELMDGLARDVLMHNPTNVYEFCANHMGKLLEIRDGPSSKKSLTLEQKILRAQEKMRQKAQERQKKFDEEMKLRSINDTSDNDIRYTTLVTEEPVVPGPSLGTLVHHENDLKNASEVEISHVSQSEKAPLCEITKSKNTDETSPTKEYLNDVTENVMGAENQNTEIMSDEHGQGIKTEFSSKLDDELIFGKVEEEAIRVEPMKEPKLEEIVVMTTIASPLQTITEASEENVVNGSVILPKITIGDGQDNELNITSNKSGQEVQSDIINELSNEGGSEKSSDILETLENNKSNNVTDCKETENETIITESNYEPGNIKSDLVHNSTEDTGAIISANNKKPNDATDETSEITQKTNSPAVTDTAPETNSNDGNVAQAASNGHDKEVSIHESHNNESPNLVIPLAHVIDAKYSHGEDSVNEPVHKDMIEDKITMAMELIQDSNVSEKETVYDPKENEAYLRAETDVDHVTISAETRANLKAETDNIEHVNRSTENETNLKRELLVEHVNMTMENEANLKADRDVEHANMTTENEDSFKADTHVECVNMTMENKANLEVDMDVELVNINTENEDKLKAETNIEHVNMAEIHIADSNIKIEPEIIQHTPITAEENTGNDYEKHDNTEISLQKSDSTENTNEDSISMVESDLSKTDDDSIQNNPNMDLETAAVTIQKVFRSFMFKSRNSTFEDTTNDEHNSVDEDNDKKEEYYAAANLNKERRPLGITRMDTVLQTVNEEKSLSLSTDDSSTLSSAATTIQAQVRGYLARNRLNSSKTYSMNSLASSHEVLEADPDQHKNKTILNIHIVPEEGNYLSRDESLITSMDLSLDGSPPSSVNLHPLSCDISERRKMLKREDAVQSVSPPSNNSGKLSEDSVKENLINENGVIETEPTDDKKIYIDDHTKDFDNEASDVISSASTVTPTTIITISKSEDPIRSPRDNTEAATLRNGSLPINMSSDESDVITPFVSSPRNSEDDSKLVHSGEFHDVVLPTKVSRSDTSAVREFKNVLVYFLLWNNGS